jgi:hypothetical protein
MLDENNLKGDPDPPGTTSTTDAADSTADTLAYEQPSSSDLLLSNPEGDPDPPGGTGDPDPPGGTGG